MKHAGGLLLLNALLFFSMGCVGTTHSNPDAGTALQVSIESGMLMGAFDDGVRVFRGIPYAAPPVGNRRWKAPEPAGKWSGIRAADRSGPVCPQPLNSDGSPNPGLAVGPSSEDCLTLNLWTPGNAKKAPVIVFIHGGAGVVGSGSVALYDGSAFARDGAVFVTINYRLGALASFAHPALTAAANDTEPLGAYGLLDQIAALGWIQCNIAAFGGDADNVTLFGQSSGGGGVLQMMTTAAAAELFHKAIVHSGNGWWAPVTLKEQEQIGSILVRNAGLSGGEADLQQLLSLSPTALQPAGVNAVDGRLRKESVTQSIAAGHIAKVPLLIGWTSFEASSFRAASAEGLVQAAPEVVREAYDDLPGTMVDRGLQYYTDSHQGAPARWIAAHAAAGAPSYLFHFSYVRTADRTTARGASHGSELPYIFDSWQKMYPGIELSEEDLRMTQLMHACWLEFARSGRPACAGAGEWPRYSSTTDQLLELGATINVRSSFRKTQLDAIQHSMEHVLSEQRVSIDRFINGTASR